MPNTPTHDFLTIASAVVLTPAVYGFLNGIEVEPVSAWTITVVVGVAHLISGILFSPDLDIDSRIHKRWGLLLFLWKPYKWVIPHRHFWSHGLILPPIMRLAYFFGMVIGLLYLVEYAFIQLGTTNTNNSLTIATSIIAWLTDHPIITISVTIGFITGGAVHSIADWLVSGGKRLLRSLFVPPKRSRVARKSVWQVSVPTRWLVDPFSKSGPRHY
jgi:uncharacterized metal-binding protein